MKAAYAGGLRAIEESPLTLPLSLLAEDEK